MNTLITGCAAGIGRALAEEFHRRGHTVYATDKNMAGLKSLQAKGIHIAELDVTDADAISNLAQGLKNDGVTIHLLVNNAGFGAMGPLLELPMGVLRTQFDVNVFSIVALVQALAPAMIQQGSGRIVNISSVSGVMPSPFAGAYCGSKAAVNAMSDSLRMELEPFGIKVITVQPGGIRSSFGDTASQGAGLKEGSLYTAVAAAIIERAQGGQQNATPAEQFAKIMADKVLVKAPRSVIRIGQNSRLMPMAKHLLSNDLLDRTLSKRFRLAGLGADPGTAPGADLAK